LENKEVSVTGRIYNIRDQSAKLKFFDLHEDGEKIQVFATANEYTGDFDFLKDTLRRGDIVGIKGHAGRTKTGELSIRPS